jgi:Putative peptidoglycan binding domain
MAILDDDAFVRLFQERAGLEVDGWAGRDTLAMLDQVLPAKITPPLQTAAGEIPEDYYPMLSRIESGDRPYIKAASSSASGLYQFIKGTWEAEGGVWGLDKSKAFGGLRPTVEEQLKRARTFTAKNALYLAKRGIPINRASLYATHFLGSVTAARLIGSDVDASAEAIAGPDATAANPSILRGKTVAQFLTWLHGKTGEWAR